MQNNTKTQEFFKTIDNILRLGDLNNNYYIDEAIKDCMYFNRKSRIIHDSYTDQYTTELVEYNYPYWEYFNQKINKLFTKIVGEISPINSSNEKSVNINWIVYLTKLKYYQTFFEELLKNDLINIETINITSNLLEKTSILYKFILNIQEILISKDSNNDTDRINYKINIDMSGREFATFLKIMVKSKIIKMDTDDNVNIATTATKAFRFKNRTNKPEPFRNAFINCDTIDDTIDTELFKSVSIYLSNMQSYIKSKI